MARQTFTWFPDFTGSEELDEKPNVNVTKFGDGYELRNAAGINFLPQVWSLTFTRTRQEIMDIRAFLRARGGVESFNWTNPYGENLVVVCREWKVSNDTGLSILTGDFEQVFES